MDSGKKRIYIALSAFCLLALFVDRIILTDGGSGPSRVEASPVAGVGASEVAQPLESQPIPNIAFPAIATDPAGNPPRDFFARPGNPTPVESPVTAPGEERLARIAFEETAKLGGVLLTADGGVAVVNGTRMVRGDLLLGCKLKNILGRSAHFQCSDGEAVLFIAPRDSKTAN